MSVVAILVALVILGIALLCWKWQHDSVNFWVSRGFVVVGSEVTGNPIIRLFNKTLFGEFDERIYQYMKSNNVPFVATTEFFKPIIVVRDLNLVKSIMASDFDHFINRRAMNFGKATPSSITQMLFFQEGE